jgi:formate dehydrogenase major subunit
MAAMPSKDDQRNPNRAVYLLPATTQFETSGSVTASNRSIQWRERVMEPLWESRTDHMIMYQLAQKLGFDKELVKNYKMQQVKGMDEPVPEDILREIHHQLDFTRGNLDLALPSRRRRTGGRSERGQRKEE